MRKIIYYVAISLDGYISGPDNDISGFVAGGNGVDKYLADLGDFDTVIMGRNTYEFGYQFGLQPGQPAYAHMTHYIFSNTLRFQNADPKVIVTPINISTVEEIKCMRGSDIYLCGGGQLAGWLLDHNLIDVVKVKLNPLILGRGTRIFGTSASTAKLHLSDTMKYENGLQIMTYKIS
jgi:dihydrofolate reductase